MIICYNILQIGLYYMVVLQISVTADDNDIADIIYLIRGSDPD